ncbi:MAG: hypothetical protein AAF658_00470, partial [Myxococcota bacterium]
RIAYDWNQGRVVLMGGATLLCSSGATLPDLRLSDTWIWDGAVWTELALPASPSTTDSFSGVWVGGSDRGPIGLSATGDDFRWLGNYWAAQPGAGPSGRSSPAFATFVTAAGNAEALMMGGFDGAMSTNETWSFGDAGWSNESAGPDARSNSAMAWSGGTVILYGGATNGDFVAGFADTWRWTPDVGWEALPCAVSVCPPGRLAGHAMARTGTPGEVLLYGGAVIGSAAVRNSVWRYDGTDWTAESDAGPGSRFGHAMVYDESRDAVLTTGGNRSRTLPGTVTRFAPAGEGVSFWRDGEGWRDARLADPEGDGSPFAWLNSFASYDADLQRTVLIGTQYGPNSNFNDGSTWLYNSGAVTRPGHRTAVVFSAAGVDGTEAVSDIVVRWLGDASGDGGGASEATGVRLRVWDQGQWNELASEDTSSLSWNFTSDSAFGANPSLLKRLFRGTAREILVEVAPQYPNGMLGDYASITTDYIEIEVRYRL